MGKGLKCLFPLEREREKMLAPDCFFHSSKQKNSPPLKRYSAKLERNWLRVHLPLLRLQNVRAMHPKFELSGCTLPSRQMICRQKLSSSTRRWDCSGRSGEGRVENDQKLCFFWEVKSETRKKKKDSCFPFLLFVRVYPDDSSCRYPP